MDEKILKMLFLALALSTVSFAAAAPDLTCPVNPVRSYMDITIESKAPQPDDANIFVYNLSGHYVKTGIPQAVIYRIDMTKMTDPNNPDAELCYALTGDGLAHGPEGRVTFHYTELSNGCVDHRFVFCPQQNSPEGGSASDKKARWMCLNGTLPYDCDPITGHGKFCDKINSPIQPCPASQITPIVYGTPANNNKHLLSHNELYLCNQTPKNYAALCWPLMLIFGLLVGASFLLGRNPFMAFDLSAPRLGRGKQYTMRVQQKRFDGMSYLMAGDQAVSAAGKFADLGRKKTDAVVGKKLETEKNKKTGKWEVKEKEVKGRVFADGQGARSWGLFSLLTKGATSLAGKIAGGPSDEKKDDKKTLQNTGWVATSKGATGNDLTKQGRDQNVNSSTYRPPTNLATSMFGSMFSAPSLLGLGRIAVGVIDGGLTRQWKKEAQNSELAGVKSFWQFWAALAKMMGQEMGLLDRDGRLSIVSRFENMQASMRTGVDPKDTDGAKGRNFLAGIGSSIKFILEIYNTANALISASKTLGSYGKTMGIGGLDKLDLSKVWGFRFIDELNKGRLFKLPGGSGRGFRFGEIVGMIKDPSTTPYGVHWLAPLIGVVRDKADGLLTARPDQDGVAYVDVGKYKLGQINGQVAIFDSKGNRLDVTTLTADQKSDIIKSMIDKMPQSDLDKLLPTLRNLTNQTDQNMNFDNLFAIYKKNNEADPNKSFDLIYGALRDSKKIPLEFGFITKDDKSATLTKVDESQFTDWARMEKEWLVVQNKIDNYALNAMRSDISQLSSHDRKLLGMLDGLNQFESAKVLDDLLNLLKDEKVDAREKEILKKLGFEEGLDAATYTKQLNRMVELNNTFGADAREAFRTLNSMMSNRETMAIFLKSMIDSDYSGQEGSNKLQTDINAYYYARETAAMCKDHLQGMDNASAYGTMGLFFEYTRMTMEERQKERERVLAQTSEMEKELVIRGIDPTKIKSSNEIPGFEDKVLFEKYQQTKAAASMYDAEEAYQHPGARPGPQPSFADYNLGLQTINATQANQIAARDIVSQMALLGLQNGLDAAGMNRLMATEVSNIGTEQLNVFSNALSNAHLDSMQNPKIKEITINEFNKALNYLSNASTGTDTELNRGKFELQMQEIETRIIPVTTQIERGVLSWDNAEQIEHQIFDKTIGGRRDITPEAYAEREYTRIDGTKTTIENLTKDDMTNGNFEYIGTQIIEEKKTAINNLVKNTDYEHSARGDLRVEQNEYNSNVSNYESQIRNSLELINDPTTKEKGIAQLELAYNSMKKDTDNFATIEYQAASTDEEGVKKNFYARWREWIDAAPFMRNPAADVLEQITGRYDPFGGLFGFGGASIGVLNPNSTGSEIISGTALTPWEVHQKVIQTGILDKITIDNRREIVGSIENYFEGYRMINAQPDLSDEVKAGFENALKTYGEILTSPAHKDYNENIFWKNMSGDNSILNPSNTFRKLADLGSLYGWSPEGMKTATDVLNNSLNTYKTELEEKIKHETEKQNQIERKNEEHSVKNPPDK